MRDYIVAVDNNGQPYIAHAFWNRKGSTKQNHKYIEKIVEGTKARYFYTQQELDAYKQKAKSGLNKAKNSITGNEEKRKEAIEMLGTGTEKRSDAVRKGSAIPNERKTAKLAADLINQYDEGREMREKGVKQYRDNKDLLGRAHDKISDAVENTSNKLKDKVGVDEADRWNKATDEYITAWNNRSAVGRELDSIYDESQKTINPFKNKKLHDAYEEKSKKYDELNKKVIETETEMNKRREEYDKTLLGKMKNISDSVSNIAEKAEEVLPAAAELTRSKFDRIKSDLSKKKESRIEQEREAFIDEIAKQTIPMVNYVQEHAKELKKSKYLVYDSETNEAVKVYDYLNRLADRRADLGEKYGNASSSAERKKYEEEIRSLTSEMISLLDDFDNNK